MFAQDGQPVRAAMYARVSADRTGRGRSVAEQLAECRAEVARRGWVEAAAFEDNDRSASRYATKARPAFAELLRRVAARDFDVLVTWEASRLQRDLAVYVELRDACRRAGVRWCYSGSLIDLEHPDDAFRAGLDAVLAERESDITRSRILRAVRANAAAGKPHGKVLWGYRRTYDPATKQLVSQDHDPDAVLILREMARRVLDGESTYSIAANLNTRGVPSPRAGANGWTLAQISRTLRNPGYAGLRTHRGVVVGPATWPPVFDEVTWRRLQALLTDPARRSTWSDGAVKHLLTGLAVCDGCGSRLYLRRTRGKGTPWSYTCVTGFHVSMAEWKLDRIVVDMLLARLRSHQADRLLAAAAGDDPEGQEALAQAALERARLDEFVEQAAAGELSATALAKVEQRIIAKVAGLEARAHRSVPSASLTLTGPGHREAWRVLPLDQQRAVVRAFMQPRLRPGVRGSHRLDPDRVLPGWVR